MKLAPSIITLLITLLSGSFSLAATPEQAGTLLVANRQDGTVSIIDIESKSEMARLLIGSIIPHELAASPDGRWAVTGEYGNSTPGQHLVVIDIATASITSRIDLGPGTRPHGLAFLSDSRHLLVTLQDADAIVLVDIVAGEVIRRFSTGASGSHMLRISRDETRAYVANRGGEGSLSIIWLNEERSPLVIPTGQGAEGIAVSPDGEKIWVANQGAGTISIIDASSFNIIATLDSPPSNRIEFLPSGQAVIPGGTSADGSIRYLNYYDGESYTISKRLAFPGSAAFGTGIRMLAADGKLFLSDSALNQIVVLDPDSAEQATLIIENPSNPDGMAWSPIEVQ